MPIPTCFVSKSVLSLNSGKNIIMKKWGDNMGNKFRSLIVAVLSLLCTLAYSNKHYSVKFHNKEDLDFTFSSSTTDLK